jgi:hypothetical protein
MKSDAAAVQLVSEDAPIPRSDIFSSRGWKKDNYDRGHGVEDPGSLYSSTIQLPANFGTPGARVPHTLLIGKA